MIDGAPELTCPDCEQTTALDGDPPRYYCPDCGARMEPS